MHMYGAHTMLFSTGDPCSNVLQGATRHCHERVDNFIVNSVRSNLFEDVPGADQTTFAEDLMSRNVQRGRDHAVPRYVDARCVLCLITLDT